MPAVPAPPPAAQENAYVAPLKQPVSAMASLFVIAVICAVGFGLITVVRIV